MNQEEIKKGNELIALFLGAKYYPKAKWYQFKKWSSCFVFPDWPHLGFHSKQLRFDNDWTDLLWAISKYNYFFKEKIDLLWKEPDAHDIRPDFNDPKNWHAWETRIIKPSFDRNILFHNLVAGIKWYNVHHKQPPVHTKVKKGKIAQPQYVIG